MLGGTRLSNFRAERSRYSYQNNRPFSDRSPGGLALDHLPVVFMGQRCSTRPLPTERTGQRHVPLSSETFSKRQIFY
jgi:hypothetical protein